MGRNLGPLNIKDTYEGLVQISGSDILTDGSGSVISSLDISASFATSASHAETSSIATTSSFVEISLDNTTNDYLTVTFVDGLGEQGLKGAAALDYNPSTRKLRTTTFEGALEGNADTATSASHAVVADSADVATEVSVGIDTTDAERYVTYVDSTGAQGVNVDANLTFNPSTNNLTTDTFTGDLVGNADTATSASHAVNADTAISASYATTASFALNVTAPTLQSVLDQGNSATGSIILTDGDSTPQGVVVNPNETESIIISTDDRSAGGDLIELKLGTTNSNAFITVENTALNISSTNGIEFNNAITATSISASSFISASEFIGDLTGNADTATTANTASYVAGANVDGTVATATSASHAIFADTAGGATDVNALYTASISDATITFDKGDASTFDITVNNVVSANSASYVMGANVDGAVATANTASYVLGANVDGAVALANTASYVAGANVDGQVASALSSSYAVTASFALNAFTPTLQQVTDAGATTTNPITITDTVATGNQALTVTGNFEIGMPGSNNTITAYSGSGIIGGAEHGTVSGKANVVIGGLYNRASGTQGTNIVLGGTDNQVDNGFRCGTLAGESLNVNGTNVVGIGGYNNLVGGTYSVFAGGTGNNLGGTSYFVGGVNNSNSSGYVFGMIGGTELDCQTDSTFLGGGNRNTTVSGHRDGAILGGNDHTINGSDTDRSVILGGNSNTIQSGSADSAVVGGATNVTIGDKSVILGGSNHNNSGERSGMLAGWDSDINGGQASTIVGGGAHTLNANYASLIGGETNTVTHDRSVVIGGTGLSTDRTDQVVVPNLKLSGTVDGPLIVTGSVEGNVSTIPVVSNTGSMDCSLGNYFELTLQNGVDTHLVATNLKAGQSITLKVTNNATSAGTLSFQPNVFAFEGGVPFSVTATTNAVDLLAFTNFNGGLLYGSGLNNFITIT
jgi:hypothetical protein